MRDKIIKEISLMLSEVDKIHSKEPLRAYEIASRAYTLSKKNNLKKEMASSLILMAKICRITTNVAKMHQLSYDAYEISNDLGDDLGKAKALNLIGITYFYKSMYEQATKTFLKSLELIETEDDLKLYCAILNNLGEVFKETESYEMAIKYYDMGIEICDEKALLNYKASMLDNKGEINLLKGDYANAYENFQDSYAIFKVDRDPIHLSEVENRIGRVHYYNKDFKAAKEYFERAFNRLEEVDNKFYGSDVLLNITRMYFENNNRYTFKYLEKAIKYSEASKSKKKMSEAYELAASIYEKTNNYKISLEYFKKHHFVEQEIKTSIMSDKLEIIKMELSRSKNIEGVDDVIAINKQLESEIMYQKLELKKIQKLNDSLEKKVFEDVLMEIPNRNYLDCNLGEYMLSCAREHCMLVLYMIDIDNFKKYNDYWGHLKGDECLKSVAAVFKEINGEKNGILGRYGGEEFIYCLCVKDYDEAFAVGESLRRRVEELGQKYKYQNKEHITTITLGGVLTRPSTESNIFELIEVADKELYKGKESGKNMLMIKEI